MKPSSLWQIFLLFHLTDSTRFAPLNNALRKGCISSTGNGYNAAFVNRNNYDHVWCTELSHRPCKLSPSVVGRENVFPLAQSMASSAPSTDTYNDHPARRLQQHRKQRHSIFRDTNAVSKSMPVPHPEHWKRCLVHTSSSSSNKNKTPAQSSLWDVAKNLFGATSHEKESRPIINDVSVKFQDPKLGACLLLEQCGVLSSLQNHHHDENGKNSCEERDCNDEKSATCQSHQPEIIMEEQETLDHLAAVLSYFQSIASAYQSPCSSLNSNSNLPQCQARIVTTLGPVGTKCPRWHADHVPVRLVMSILGPGCEYIPHENEILLMEPGQTSSKGRVVDRSALNHLEEEDTLIANDIIIPPSLVSLAQEKLINLQKKDRVDKSEGAIMPILKHAKDGEVVLLMGRGWEDIIASDSLSENGASKYDGSDVLAAVHRSPSLLPNQERILLTVDLVNWDY